MAVEKGLVELFGEVVSSAGSGLKLDVVTPQGSNKVSCGRLNYIFGNSDYIKEQLDKYSQSAATDALQVPLVALMCPFTEQRGARPELSGVAKVNVIIACSTRREYDNVERLEYSFRNILRPIYCRIMEELVKHRRFDTPYRGDVPHSYSENYSYGKYGAYTSSGERVSEPIDAIDIRDLELRIVKPNCRNL